MNENILKNLLYTKVITNDNGAEVRIPMTEEEIIQYDENVAESRRKASLPEYKFATCIGKPDGTVEFIKATDEEIKNIKQQLQMQFLPNLREIRDNLLKETDILVLPDRWSTYSEDKKTKISNYRQALRDLPANVVYIEDKDINSYMPDKPY